MDQPAFIDRISVSDSDVGCVRRVVRTSIMGDVVGTGVVPGRHALALQKQIIEQARGAESEQVRGQPL